MLHDSRQVATFINKYSKRHLALSSHTPRLLHCYAGPFSILPCPPVQIRPVSRNGWGPILDERARGNEELYNSHLRSGGNHGLGVVAIHFLQCSLDWIGPSRRSSS